MERSVVHEDAREMHRTKILVGKFRKMVRRMDRQGGNSDMVQEMLVLCEAENGTKIDELLQARANRHKGAWTNVETNSGPRGRQSSCKGGKKLKN